MPQLQATDILAFPGYIEKLERAQRSTGDKDAVLCGRATIGGEPCAIFIMDGDFMMGSMGSVVGEKIAAPLSELLSFACRSWVSPSPVVPACRRAPPRLCRWPKSGSACALRQDGPPLPRAPHRSDHGRRDGQLRHGGRHHPRRARCAHRLRGAARRGADHSQAPPRRLPAFRIPARAWLSRPYRRARERPFNPLRAPRAPRWTHSRSRCSACSARAT